MSGRTMTDEPDGGLRDEPGDAGDDATGMLCSNCLAVNDPLADYCHHCGHPIARYGATDPFKSIFVQGHGYQAVMDRPTGFRLAAIVLIFGTTALSNAVVLSFAVWQLFEHYGSPVTWGEDGFTEDILLDFEEGTIRNVAVRQDLQRRPPWQALVGLALLLGVTALHAALIHRTVRRYRGAKRDAETGDPFTPPPDR